MARLTEWPTSNQERELLGVASFTDLPTAQDIRTDNVGTFEEWDKANRREGLFDPAKDFGAAMTLAEVEQVKAWYMTLVMEYHGTL